MEINKLEELHYDELIHERGLIRVRVCSRFRLTQKHMLGILYLHIQRNDNQNMIEGAIGAYSCTCEADATTVGQCAHVTSVLYFSEYARSDNNIRYPSTAH